MDFGDSITGLLFIAWILSRVWSALRKKPAATASSKPPGEPQPADDKLAPSVIAHLERAEQQIRELLPTLDARLADIARPQLEQALLELTRHAERLTALMESEEPKAQSRLALQTRSAREHLTQTQRHLIGVRALITDRQLPHRQTAYALADRLVADLYNPMAGFATAHGLELAVPAPLALFHSTSSSERLERTNLDRATISIPEQSLTEPVYWSALGSEFGLYLGEAFPTLHAEIHQALELDTQAAEGLDASADAMARLLVSAWLGQLLADVIGALLLGPSYLRGLIETEARPHSPGQVTALRVSRAGEVSPQPPAHMRVEATASWLQAMGDGPLAVELSARWSSQHGSPQTLKLTGGYASGAVPIEPLSTAIEDLLATLDATQLDALGGVRLAQLAGVDGWRQLAGERDRATQALREGQAASVPVRALIAAAVDAGSETPDAGSNINRGLLASLEHSVARPTRASGPRSRKRHRPDNPLAPQRVVEALLLGDIVLESRSRSG